MTTMHAIEISQHDNTALHRSRNISGISQYFHARSSAQRV
jgi:hypothetical protein